MAINLKALCIEIFMIQFIFKIYLFPASSYWKTDLHTFCEFSKILIFFDDWRCPI